MARESSGLARRCSRGSRSQAESMVFPATRSTASPTRFAQNRTIQWIHVRHEETAAFAAGAEAHLTGRLAVCAGSCGPGNLHLINGLYDCHRSRVPVLAIAAQIPSNEIGSGYFQETHPEHLFAQCSHYCELVSQPEQMPRVLEIAMQTAHLAARRCGDRHAGRCRLARCRRTGPRLHFPPPKPSVCPSDDEIATLAKVLNQVEEDHDPRRRGLRRSSCRVDRACRQAESADRACDARQRVHRVRQSVRRGHDRPARILLRLSRDDELRRCC